MTLHRKGELFAKIQKSTPCGAVTDDGGGTLTASDIKLLVKSGRKESIQGDVNADGEFNVSDLVLLQKWLLAVPDTKLADWKAADFCKDDRLDVFDLCLMRRELIAKSQTP